MTTQTLPVGSRTGITITITSLANVTYVASSAVDLSAVDAVDCIVEVEITPGTVSGNKQAKLFIQASLDNSNFGTGPASGTTVTDEPVLIPLGILPLPSNSTLQRKQYSMVDRIGWVPPYWKLVVFNDSGASFGSSACAANYATVTGSSA